MILHSLRSRLVLMSAVIAALVAVAAGLTFRRVTTLEVDRFASEVEATRHAPLRELLSSYYAERGSWDGVEDLLRRLENATGSRIGVSAGGTMVAVSSGPFGGAAVKRLPNGTAHLDQRQPGRYYVLRLQAPAATIEDAAGREVGAVWLLPRALADERPQTALRRDLNRWLLLIITIAGLAGLALSIAVARRIAGPIERLTLAVRDFANGRLDRRVAVERQDEIGALAAAFNDLVAKLARNEELRRNIVSDVAHELRTPLTNIRGELEAIQDGLLVADRRVVDSLHEEVLVLARLVDELQQLSLADAGQLTLDIETCSLAAAADRALASASRAATEKRVRLDSRVPPDLEIEADPERLLQILRNLLANAVAHTPAGGEVAVSAAADPERTRIQISDTGSGIDERDLPFVFDRFYRADASRSRATGGAGLGLAIVKRLVELHGGTIAVESTPGEGTTFTIELPRIVAEAGAVLSSRTRPASR